MSVADRLLAGETVELADLRSALFRALFGDRLGATLALAALVWVGVTWRLGFASNDQYTFANTVLAVADGQLHITDPVYGPSSGATPGTYLVDGRVYGRNYGIVLLSTVWYVCLRTVSVVADVRVLLTGLWSLALVVVATRFGERFDRRRAGSLGGAVVAGSLFALSLLVVDPLSSWWLPQIALQLTTALATAAVAVVCYRLVTRLSNRRLGVATAVATVAATPIGFWATLPKRHSVTVILVVCAMYTLFRSRDARTDGTALQFRALTYVWPALLAWVHAPHGFILLVAVGVVDLPTARTNGARELLTVGVAFGVALLPFFLTNTLISGNPVAPPRFLPDYSGDVLTADAELSSAVTDGGESGGGGLLGGLPLPVGGIVSRFVGSYLALLEPARLFRVFVHTGYVSSLRPAQDAAINLSVLASMPLLGALLAYPVLAARWLTARSDWTFSPRTWSPTRAMDAFTVVYVFLLLGLYFRSLPLHHMLTVRYLHPLYLLGVYWLVRLPAVRRVVAMEPRSLALSYGGTVLVALPAYLGAIAVGGLVLDESIQLYALAALGVAVGVGGWAVAAELRGRYTQAGAVALGVGAGAMTVYLLVAGLSLFPTTGEFLLPASRVVSEQIQYARLIGSSPPY